MSFASAARAAFALISVVTMINVGCGGEFRPRAAVFRRTRRRAIPAPQARIRVGSGDSAGFMAWPRRSRRASSSRHTPRESVVRPMSRAAPYPTLGVTAERCSVNSSLNGTPNAARPHRLLPSCRTPWPLRATEVTNQHYALMYVHRYGEGTSLTLCRSGSGDAAASRKQRPGAARVCLGPAVPFQGGAPLESPATAPPAWGRQGSTPPRARLAAAPQNRRAADAGHAAAPGPPDLRGGRPSALRRDARPARLRWPWRAAKWVAMGLVRDAPGDVSSVARPPAGPSVAATPPGQGRSAALRVPAGCRCAPPLTGRGPGRCTCGRGRRDGGSTR